MQGSRRFLVAALAAWLVASLLAGCATPRREAPALAGAPPPVEIVRRDERLDLSAGVKSLRVSNPHGDVRVRFADSAQLRLIATVQRIGVDPLDPEFRLAVEREVVIAEVHYAGERELLARGGHAYGRSDIVLVAPRGLAVEIETRDGLAQVRNARGSVRVRTHGGSIEVSGGADLDLRSHGGRIGFSQSSGQWPTQAVACSDGGDILATVPAFADIVLDARAAQIGVDPTLPVAASVERGGQRVLARFGQALRRLEIDAGAGTLYLRPGIRPDAISPPAPEKAQ